MSTTASGAALAGLSDNGYGVVAATGGGTPGTAGLLATNGGRGFAIHALSSNSLPAILASGSDTSATTAEGGTDGAALELFNGGFTLSGTIRPAFLHTAAAGNIIGIRTVINHPLLNGRSNAIVTASHVFDSSVGFVPGGIGVLYDVAAARWSILREDSLAMPVGARFNVIVFNQ